MNIYREQGYASRGEYLLALSEEFEVDLATIVEVATILGSNEDFDGLPNAIEDYLACFGG